jgi:hypothetical protein
MISRARGRPTYVSRGEPRAEVVLLRDDAELDSWPLICPGPPDLSVVDDLARMQLAARRLGCSIWLRQACPELTALIELAGLAHVVTFGPQRPLQAVGEAEGGEEGGVEEVVVPDDPVS